MPLSIQISQGSRCIKNLLAISLNVSFRNEKSFEIYTCISWDLKATKMRQIPLLLSLKDLNKSFCCNLWNAYNSRLKSCPNSRTEKSKSDVLQPGNKTLQQFCCKIYFPLNFLYRQQVYVVTIKKDIQICSVKNDYNR